MQIIINCTIINVSEASKVSVNFNLLGWLRNKKCKFTEQEAWYTHRCSSRNLRFLQSSSEVSRYDSIISMHKELTNLKMNPKLLSNSHSLLYTVVHSWKKNFVRGANIEFSFKYYFVWMQAGCSVARDSEFSAKSEASNSDSRLITVYAAAVLNNIVVKCISIVHYTIV